MSFKGASQQLVQGLNLLQVSLAQSSRAQGTPISFPQFSVIPAHSSLQTIRLLSENSLVKGCVDGSQIMKHSRETHPPSQMKSCDASPLFITSQP